MGNSSWRGSPASASINMSEATPIPVIIIGGYLGSGKTSFINACLQNGLRNAAIIVNDFGDINIDAALISQYSTDTVELTNGCICCSIGESLADTLFSILDRPQLPELIVIETSGVSDPASVAAYTHMKGLTNAGILVLVDSTEAKNTFRNQLLRQSFVRQIQSADVLAITKSDIAAPDERENTQKLLQQLAVDTPVVASTPLSLTEIVANGVEVVTPLHMSSQTHELIKTVHHFSSPPTKEELVNYLESLDHSIIRAKGVVGLANSSNVLVQKTGRHLSATTTTVETTGLVLLALPNS